MAPSSETPRRVLITGDAGRGKSTFARKLAGALGLPLHSTDDFYWKVWLREPADRQESIDAVTKLYEGDAWVVEGTTRHLIGPGMDRAGVIYLLTFRSVLPQYLSLFRRYLGRKDETFRDFWALAKHATLKRHSKTYKGYLPSWEGYFGANWPKVIRLDSFAAIRAELARVARSAPTGN